MLNEWKEFQDYTGAVKYTARNKQDTTYLGRFTFDTILDFEGLNRVLTILARGFLFHNENGSPVKAPRERIDYAKRGLCAWCSVPDNKKAFPKKWKAVSQSPSSRISFWIRRPAARASWSMPRMRAIFLP